MEPDVGTRFCSPFDTLMNAANEADALLRLQAAARGLGFDHTLFAVIPRPAVDAAQVYLRSNYPAGWTEHYDRHNLRAVDPTVAYCFRSNAPFVWLPHSFTTPAQQALYEEACAHGVRAGVTLPIRGAAGEIGMLTCVRDQQPGPALVRELERNLGGLSLLRDVAFDALRAYLQPAAQPAPAAPAEPVPALTAREKDCLQWMSAGKTAWEIGRILNISEAGVNFHIANLRHKFGVNRRNDVVIRAIRLGLIDLPG